MSVFVRYNVPVLAEVDLSVGRVLRVQVDDEAVTGAEQVFAVDQAPLEDNEQRRAARSRNRVSGRRGNSADEPRVSSSRSST